MSVWEHTPSSRADFLDEAHGTTKCLFCSTPLIVANESWKYPDETGMRSTGLCRTCGWWTVGVIQHDMLAHTNRSQVLCAAGCLRELDLTDVQTPIDEVCAYLTAKYEARFDVHPKVFEEVVGSVFRSLGYAVRVTAYTGDNGLDVILDGDKGEIIGIQVKRYKDKIGVEQIRELAGALLVNGLTQGIFITTSSFQSGAKTTAAKCRTLGYPIELMDATRFLDALQIRQSSTLPLNADIQNLYQDVRLHRLPDLINSCVVAKA